ncbi:MAG: hypothetical protein JSW65_02790 [Candidatus Bipolaricaulota bacterium]|nr:MAG: hypothetical protein JSW65_02790 [Candidatus Bipolaricaulota bacterium]
MTTDRCPEDHAWIDASRFVRFAGEDLELWSEVEGASVIPRDARRGTGSIETVRWGALGRQDPPRVLLRIVYSGGLVSTVAASRLATIATRLSVRTRLATLLDAPSGGGDPMEAERRLHAYAHEVRTTRAAARAARARRMQETRRRRKATDRH